MWHNRNSGVIIKHSIASDFSPKHNYMFKQGLGGPSDPIKSYGCYTLMVCSEAFTEISH